MKTTTTRPVTAEERATLERILAPTPSRHPGPLLGFFVALPATAALFLFLNLLLPAPPLVNFLLAAAGGVGGAWLYGKREGARFARSLEPAPEVQAVLRKDLAEGRAAVTRYDVDAVVKVVADRRRLVATTWLARLADGAVALLVQPELEAAEEDGEFPATSFEIASGESSHFCLSVTRLGEPLAPAVVRAPFTDAEWEELGDDADAPVPFTWEEVLERAARNAIRVSEGKSRREAGAAPRNVFEEAAAKGTDPADPIRPK